MIRRSLYIFLVLMMISLSSIARYVSDDRPDVVKTPLISFNADIADHNGIDTNKVKKPDPDDKKKIKEIPTAKRQAKPEKLVFAPIVDTLKGKVKPPRQRRPDGLVRPPEIPRRNN